MTTSNNTPYDYKDEYIILQYRHTELYNRINEMENTVTLLAKLSEYVHTLHPTNIEDSVLDDLFKEYIRDISIYHSNCDGSFCIRENPLLGTALDFESYSHHNGTAFQTFMHRYFIVQLMFENYHFGNPAIDDTDYINTVLRLLDQKIIG